MDVRRPLFGRSRRETWRKLAEALDAKFREGGFLRSDRVEARHGDWTITLDAYFCAATKATHTRLRAPYVNPEGFRFTVSRRGLFSDLATRLGMQDVQVGHPEFDRDFVIKGNDEAKLRALFADPEIRRLLSAQPRVHFTVEDDGGDVRPLDTPDTDVLAFHVVGVLEDVERLERLFELFAATLDRLCVLGSAYEDA